MTGLVEILIKDLGRNCWRWAWVTKEQALNPNQQTMPPGAQKCPGSI